MRKKNIQTYNFFFYLNSNKLKYFGSLSNTSLLINKFFQRKDFFMIEDFYKF